jgi:poly(3-hydroxybutyrate) depolymerase
VNTMAHSIYRSILLVTILFISRDGFGQDSDYKTYTYYKHDSATLQLDLFLPDSAGLDSPLVIYLHGGGFSGGNRNRGHSFCRVMAENGIPAATISYSLSMKGKSFSCDGILLEKLKAIHLAAHEARIATSWFLQHAGIYGIDTNRIFLSGSSAGAEAALMAGFMESFQDESLNDPLPSGFRYAGIISGAGALLDINMISTFNVTPVLSYHGTCDPLVPYYIAPHHYCSQASPGYMMMFGSHAIHERIITLNGSSQLMTYCNEGHQHAGTPFTQDETWTVLDFIHRTLSGERFNIHRTFYNTDSCETGPYFEFCQ